MAYRHLYNFKTGEKDWAKGYLGECFDVGPPKSVGGPQAFVGFEHIYIYIQWFSLTLSHTVPAASHGSFGPSVISPGRSEGVSRATSQRPCSKNGHHGYFESQSWPLEHAQKRAPLGEGSRVDWVRGKPGSLIASTWDTEDFIPTQPAVMGGMCVHLLVCVCVCVCVFVPQQWYPCTQCLAKLKGHFWREGQFLVPSRLDGERRNSLPTHLSESESERAVGMWMEGGAHEVGLEGREWDCPLNWRETQQFFVFFLFFWTRTSLLSRFIFSYTTWF